MTESAHSSKMYETGAKIDSINLKGGISRISFLSRYNVGECMGVSILIVFPELYSLCGLSDV